MLAQPWQSDFDFVEVLVSRFNLRLLFEQADTPLSVQQFLIISRVLRAGRRRGRDDLLQMNPGLIVADRGLLLAAAADVG